MRTSSFLESYEVDLSGIPFQRRVKISDTEEDVYPYEGIAAWNDAVSVGRMMFDRFLEFIRKVEKAAFSFDVVIRKTEYQQIAFPILLGIKPGEYAPAEKRSPILKYTFYARTKLNRKR